MDADNEEHVIALQALTHLARTKLSLVDRLLKPAGVPGALYEPVFLLHTDPRSPYLGNREMIAGLILEAILGHPQQRLLLRAIIKVAAAWSDFDATGDLGPARAAVRRAWRYLEYLQNSESLNILRGEIGDNKDLVSRAAQASALSAQRPDAALLLRMYTDLLKEPDAARKGWLLHDLLNRLFLLHEINLLRRFQPPADGATLDGLFKLGAENLLLFCQFRERLNTPQQIEPCLNKLPRAGSPARGVLLALAGWSEAILPGLSAARSACLMDSDDLRAVLEESVNLRALLQAKLDHLPNGRPFYSAAELRLAES